MSRLIQLASANATVHQALSVAIQIALSHCVVTQQVAAVPLPIGAAHVPMLRRYAQPHVLNGVPLLKNALHLLSLWTAHFGRMSEVIQMTNQRLLSAL